MSLSKTLYPLLSTGSTQEDQSRHDWKSLDWDLKNRNQKKVLVLTHVLGAQKKHLLGALSTHNICSG